jgi:hypothetical protein
LGIGCFVGHVLGYSKKMTDHKVHEETQSFAPFLRANSCGFVDRNLSVVALYGKGDAL